MEGELDVTEKSVSRKEIILVLVDLMIILLLLSSFPFPPTVFSARSSRSVAAALLISLSFTRDLATIPERNNCVNVLSSSRDRIQLSGTNARSILQEFIDGRLRVSDPRMINPLRRQGLPQVEPTD